MYQDFELFKEFCEKFDIKPYRIMNLLNYLDDEPVIYDDDYDEMYGDEY